MSWNIDESYWPGPDVDGAFPQHHDGKPVTIIRPNEFSVEFRGGDKVFTVSGIHDTTDQGFNTGQFVYIPEESLAEHHRLFEVIWYSMRLDGWVGAKRTHYTLDLKQVRP